MRISSGILGILGFIVLIVFTGICSVVTYGTTHDGIITLWQGGVRVESMGEVAQALMNPADFNPTSTPTIEASEGNVLVIPSITPIATVGIAATPDPINTPEATSEVAVAPQATIDPSADYRYSNPRQVNIVLLGIDERTGYTSERAYRTDTMMVLHVDPVRRSAGVISFPRDLWVEIPNFSVFERLNTANYIGDNNAYPGGGGPALLMETLNANFGIQVDYYVRVNFTVFETVVDRLAPDGVEICIEQAINDPTYPDVGFGTIVVDFQPGCQRLDGERLLQYARTRKTEGGDLDRARRQQQVIEALRQYVLSAGGIQNFITQIGPLWNDLAGSYRTNLTLNEIIGLAFLVSDIPRENIRYQVIGAGYVQPGTTATGDQILIPIHSSIQDLITNTFYPAPPLSLAELQTRALADAVDIRIFNGTTISGLANNTREYLLGRGVNNITEVGNVAEPTNSQTVIRDYGGGRNTALWLAALLGIPEDRIQRGSDGLAASGVVVVVGTDMPTIISGGQ